MLEQKKISKNGIVKKEVKFIKEDLTQETAIKKQKILDIISEGSQLTLLGLLIEQIGEKIELDTPEYTYAKEVFVKIQEVLNS